jgi:adenine deaminase
MNDSEITRAINALIAVKGGICCVKGLDVTLLSLPVAGLMTNEDGYQVAAEYEMLTHKARQMGSMLRSPFMTLSFMALLVIPELKLSDKGLFDGKTFSFTSLFTS